MTMIPFIDQITSPPEVGQLYMVPSYESSMLHQREGGPNLLIPMLGPIHNDNIQHPYPFKFLDGINGHIDTRFIERKVYPAQGDGWRRGWDSERLLQPQIKNNQVIANSFGYRVFRCLHGRCERDNTDWAARQLFEKYLNHSDCTKLIDGRCPHQGTYLGSVMPDADGIIHCPAHGLRFKGGIMIEQSLTRNPNQ